MTIQKHPSVWTTIFKCHLSTAKLIVGCFTQVKHCWLSESEFVEARKTINRQDYSLGHAAVTMYLKKLDLTAVLHSDRSGILIPSVQQMHFSLGQITEAACSMTTRQVQTASTYVLLGSRATQAYLDAPQELGYKDLPYRGAANPRNVTYIHPENRPEIGIFLVGKTNICDHLWMPQVDTITTP